MKRTIILILISIIFFTPSFSYAQGGKIQKFINTLKKDTIFTDAIVGIMVMDSKGKTIASWNPDMPMLTASTMKTVTTGLCLNLLGPDYKFSTKIGYTGFIQDGVLYGDLFIIGGGDPTLGSKDTLASPIDSIFDQWTIFIKKAGIKRINGNVVADDRFFIDEPLPESWAWSNLGTSYGSTACGLSFCENIQYFKFRPGVNIGDKAYLESTYPIVPGMEYKNNIVSSGSRTGDRSSYFVSDISKLGEFRGTLPSGKDSVIVSVSNKYPALSCAYHFRDYLYKQGILSDPVIKDAKSYNSPSGSEIQIIGETLSPKLSNIVNVTNRISNNFYAETLLKMIGKTVTGVGSYDSSIVAVKRLLVQMGMPLKGFTQEDGSGLSRQNYVSARFFCNYFSKMKESNNFAAFFNSLPQPGGPGTLKSVLIDEDEQKKSQIHAKSGSLSSVKCYAGYVKKEKGPLYFAILTNNYSAKTSQIMIGIEGFMKELIK